MTHATIIGHIIIAGLQVATAAIQLAMHKGNVKRFREISLTLRMNGKHNGDDK